MITRFTPIRTLLLAAVFLYAAAGCGQAVHRNALPAGLAPRAEIAGMPNVRYWGDQLDPRLQAEFVRVAKEKPVLADTRSEVGPGIGGLVLSGGGDRGAYGAGLLCGWSERGTRPRFRIVTGVSTGALIAPMAFLGPKYDPLLRDSYTKVSAKDIIKMWPFLDWLKFDSMADSKPLAGMTERQFGGDMLDEIAAEHAKGRRLFVQTVDLDAQRPVIWDMGAIASSGHPDAPKLFRQVLLASASIPVAFPPQYIKVQVDGKTYDEMHVDGGTASQMLMSTLPVNLADVRKQMGATAHRPSVHVIRNGYVRPEWQSITPKLFPIAGRAIDSMIKSQACTELSLMYYEAQAAGIEFNLACLPDDYQRQGGEQFDTAEMNRMFNRGYEDALHGNPWRSKPPKLDLPTAAAAN
jgi:predicted acylesterase/phospholipase RssA